ncbi:hypothetical protein NPIL_514111 [Nephila pilipes]|uniref:Uncharacterized protein n=1 Tax=Nephila pilipes TaxID=299642 RepID=A0A8X6Q6X6_NEPPI|nr:hypothetical protein NPIL_514111 [Nephila pilipes]
MYFCVLCIEFHHIFRVWNKGIKCIKKIPRIFNPIMLNTTTMSLRENKGFPIGACEVPYNRQQPKSESIIEFKKYISIEINRKRSKKKSSSKGRTSNRNTAVDVEEEGGEEI